MKRLFAPVLAIMFLGALSASAQTDLHDSRSYARLSHVQGDVHVQRGGDMGAEAGTVNLVVVEGDKLAVRNGRAEVSFEGLNALRLNALTQVEFVNLPRGGVEPYKFHLSSGGLILRVGRLAADREFEVHTPDASLYVLSEGLFRVDVMGNGNTRLSALEGEAEAAGAQESHRLFAGQSVTAVEGRFLSGPAESYAGLDDFGRWSESRDGLLAAGRSSSSYLPEELYGYESELGEYGDWRYEADYGHVWVPRVRYYDDWRPYSYGRWVWYPVIGWTWIADEPWGWCVYHYGRWHWGLSLGWYWIPTRHWGPAWVHWHWDGHYVGWCALNWWNRPTVVINNHFYVKIMGGTDTPFTTGLWSWSSAGSFNLPGSRPSPCGATRCGGWGAFRSAPGNPPSRRPSCGRAGWRPRLLGRSPCHGDGASTGPSAAVARRPSTRGGRSSTAGEAFSVPGRAGREPGRGFPRAGESSRPGRIPGGSAGLSRPSGRGRKSGNTLSPAARAATPAGGCGPERFRPRMRRAESGLRSDPPDVPRSGHATGKTRRPA